VPRASAALRAPGAHVSVDKKSLPFFKTGKEMHQRLNQPVSEGPTSG